METNIENAPRRVDLHAHALGEKSDEKIIDDAARKNVIAISLGRRGGGVLQNYDELISYGKQRGVEVITEIEYTPKVENEGFADLIALGFNHKHPAISQWQEEVKNWNSQAAKKQLALLENKGFVFDKENEALRKTLSGDEPERAWRLAFIAAQETANKDLLSRLKQEHSELWHKTQTKYGEIYKDNTALDAKFLWSLFFASKKEAYIPAEVPGGGPKEFIETIHRAGGLVFYSPEGNFKDKIWSYLQEMGIDGIMLWHGGHLESPTQDRRFFAEVRSRGYLILGGSDYDPEKNHWQVGIGNGALYISPKRLAEFKSRLARQLST